MTAPRTMTEALHYAQDLVDDAADAGVRIAGVVIDLDGDSASFQLRAQSPALTPALAVALGMSWRSVSPSGDDRAFEMFYRWGHTNGGVMLTASHDLPLSALTEADLASFPRAIVKDADTGEVLAGPLLVAEAQSVADAATSRRVLVEAVAS